MDSTTVKKDIFIKIDRVCIANTMLPTRHYKLQLLFSNIYGRYCLVIVTFHVICSSLINQSAYNFNSHQALGNIILLFITSNSSED